MTITLELPDDLAERFEALPPEQRNNFAVAWLRLGVERDEEPAAYPLTEEDKASLARAFADVEAGRVFDGDAVLAEMRQWATRAK